MPLSENQRRALSLLSTVGNHAVSPREIGTAIIQRPSEIVGRVNVQHLVRAGFARATPCGSKFVITDAGRAALGATIERNYSRELI